MDGEAKQCIGCAVDMDHSFHNLATNTCFCPWVGGLSLEALVWHLLPTCLLLVLGVLRRDPSWLGRPWAWEGAPRHCPRPALWSPLALQRGRRARPGASAAGFFSGHDLGARMPGMLAALRPVGPVWLPWGPGCLWPAGCAWAVTRTRHGGAEPTPFLWGGSLVSVLPPQTPSPLLTSLKPLPPQPQGPSLDRSLRAASSGVLAQSSHQRICSIAWSSRDPACCPRTSRHHLLPPNLARPHLPAQGGWLRSPGWLQAGPAQPPPPRRIYPRVGLG